METDKSAALRSGYAPESIDPAFLDTLTSDLAAHLNVAVEQIWYWRSHLDVFIRDYLHIKLFDTQQVIARAIGNCSDVALALCRGYGKTWLLSVCAVALAILWPGSRIAVVSKTAGQANLLIDKIVNELLPNADIEREIDYSTGRGIKVNMAGRSAIYFKGGSSIRSYVLGFGGDNVLGIRAKVLIIDESKLVPQGVVDGALRPTTREKRRQAFDLKEYGFEDYPSKIINISSAFFKSNDFYFRFKNTLDRMASGDKQSFAAALNDQSAIRIGLADEEFYERARQEMPPTVYAMEYGSIFAGAADDAVFPYSLTESCRTLNSVELLQPQSSRSQYIISMDVAGSAADTADNSCIAVFKIVERSSGRWSKHLVWMRAYRGYSQRQLAEEVRKIYLRFPNTVRIVYDANAIGRGLESLFDEPFHYEDAKGVQREMLPLLPHDSLASYPSIKILYPFIANNALNNEMVNVILRNLEDRDFLMPVVSTMAEKSLASPRLETEEDNEETKAGKRRRTQLLKEELAVFQEADALQVELGNIVARVSAQGNILYGTAVSTQRKDRFSTVGMALWNIDQMESAARKDRYSGAGEEIPVAIGGVF